MFLKHIENLYLETKFANLSMISLLTFRGYLVDIKEHDKIER